MSYRRQRSIPLGGRYRQVSLFYWKKVAKGWVPLPTTKARNLRDYTFNTLKPRQNGRRLADDIFERIFLNENIWILINISLNVVPKSQINNFPTLVKIMAWRRTGDKPLSEPMLIILLTHICVTRPQWVIYPYICSCNHVWGNPYVSYIF